MRQRHPRARAAFTRALRVPEATEQSNGVRLLRTIGAAVYVLGTRRRRGDHQGTMQTPGISDVIAFLPRFEGVLFWEAKAAGGTMSPEQEALQAIVCQYATSTHVWHVVGGYDRLIAFLQHRLLVSRDQVPAHHYETFVPAIIARDDSLPREIQAEGERRGRELRARAKANQMRKTEVVRG